MAKTNIRRLAGEETFFLDCLNLSRTRLVSDTRDHVHAIFDLIDHDDFQPDYNNSVRTVYREVIASVISRNGNLDVFSSCKSYTLALLDDVESTASLGRVSSFGEKGIQDFEEKHLGLIQDLPSWVPDWQQRGSENENLLLWKSCNCWYQACGGSAPKVRFIEGEMVMAAEGLRIDRIKMAIFDRKSAPDETFGHNWYSAARIITLRMCVRARLIKRKHSIRPLLGEGT